MPGTIAKIKGIHVNAGMFVPATNIDLVGSPSKKGPCRASVLYGRNGSGKTTISEEIAAIASSREHTHVKGRYFQPTGVKVIQPI